MRAAPSRWVVGIAAAGGLLSVLVACERPGVVSAPRASTPATVTATPTATATPGAPAPTPTGRIPELRIVDSIDIGGGQAYGLAVGRDAVWATSYDDSTVVRIEPVSGRVTRTVTVPGAATLMASGSGLWVGAYGSGAVPGAVHRVDPASGRVTYSADAGELCCDLAIGGGLVWAVDAAGRLVGIDAATGRVVRRLTVAVDRDVHTNAVYAAGALWVASDNGPLRRVDPVTGAARAYQVGGVPFRTVGNLVWGASATAVWAVDARTGAVVRRVPLADSMEVMALAVDGDSLWIGMRHPGYVGAVQHVDLHGRVLGESRAVGIPARVEVGFGAVWVTDSGGRVVVRFGR